MMLRRQIYLTAKQIKGLKKVSKELNVSASECIRRIIDHHIGMYENGRSHGFGKRKERPVKKKAIAKKKTPRATR